MKNPRKFELRNGMIIVENDDNLPQQSDGIYSSMYQIIDKKENKFPINWLCLSLQFNGSFPKGGVNKKDFDIIKEIKNEN